MSTSLAAMLLCALVASAAIGVASPYADSRIDLKVTYGRSGVELELTNKASSPIVAWELRFSPKWEEVRDPRTVARPGATPRTRGRLTCAAGSGRTDLIEPGETRYFAANPPRNCPDRKLHHVSAIFADGTWTGEWSDLEFLVKGLTIRRLVLQRWLISLRALEAADDPLANLGKLMDDLKNVRGVRITTPGTPPPEEYLRKVIDFRAQFALRMYVKRCYENLVLSDYGRMGNPKVGRDEQAEKQLKSRADAKERIAEGIAREIEQVSNELDDLAWVTMFGPNGERIGPAVPPPPPRKRQERQTELKTRP